MVDPIHSEWLDDFIQTFFDLRKSKGVTIETALAVFAYRIKQYIGAYTASLGRVDALVFTASIGENAPLVSERACQGLKGLGIAIDKMVSKRLVHVGDAEYQGVNLLDQIGGLERIGLCNPVNGYLNF